MSLAPRGIYLFDEFQLNLDLRLLARQGRRVSLGPKAYEILTCLVLHAGKAVSKADLLKEVWAESYVEEGTLTQHIFSLRKALGDKADTIITVPGYGYRFEGIVRHVMPESAGWQITPSGDVVQEMRERTRVVVEEPILPAIPASTSARLYVAVTAGVLLLVGAMAWMWVRRAPAMDHVTVVLSDFVNMTGDTTFDRTLGQALQITLEQSPYVDVMGEGEKGTTLGLMSRPKDTALTPAIGREICLRAHRQVLLSGSISSVGDQYLLTLEANDCNTGKIVAAAKSRALKKGNVLDALDTVSESVRSKLGESAKSIKSFGVPLQDATTSSLEALQAYSVGKYVQAQADGFQKAVPLFQRAIQLDPQFGQAYGELASAYYNLGEPLLEAEYMKKAYDLRDRVGMQDRFTFEAHYLDSVLGDMPTAVKVYQEWSESYPRDWVPWLDAANLYQQLGRYDEAIDPARHALALDRSVLCYIVLARALKSAGRFAETKELGRQAEKEGKDSGPLRTILLEVAVDEHDANAFAQESKALANFKNGYPSYYLGKAASMRGKFAQADEFLRTEVNAQKQQGLIEAADSVAVDEAMMQREMGFPDVARKTLLTISKVEAGTAEYAVERVKEGDLVFADHFLALHRDDKQLSTDLMYLQLPEIRAAVALARKKPLDAIAALAGPNPYGLAPLSTLMLRGRAFLEAGQFQQAAAQYKVIIANPGHGFDVEHPLAHLGLARAYAGMGDSAASRAEYESFLVEWKDGDPDVPILKTAKAELARLS